MVPDISVYLRTKTIITLGLVRVAQASYTNEEVIGIDAAGSEFYKDGKYDLDFKNPDSDPA